MSFQFSHKNSIIGSTFVLIAIIGIFGISLFTVVNLTAAYEPENNNSNILGVESALPNSKSLSFKDISELTKPITRVSFDQKANTLKLNIENHQQDQYFFKLFRITNTSKEEKTLDLSIIETTLPKSTKNYITVNDQKFASDTAMPELVISPDKSVEVGLFIDSTANVNFKSSVTILFQAED